MFLLITVVLLLSTLGFSVKEYMESDSRNAMENQIEKRENEALKEGSSHDPFSNNETHDPLSDNDYTKTIAGLEDIVVPGRGSGRHHDNNGDHSKNKKPGKREEKYLNGSGTRAYLIVVDMNAVAR